MKMMNKEKRLEYQRRYREKHKEELRQKAREKYANDPKKREYHKKKGAEWAKNHKDTVKEYNRRHREKNPYLKKKDDKTLKPSIDNVFEIWEEIEGTDGNYYVSNYGRVWSRVRGIIGHKNGMGYYEAFINGKHYLVHRLVAKAFIPNPHNYPEIDHIDTDITNNVWTNLRWTDRKGNQNNPITIEKFKALGRSNFGETCNDKPVAQYSLDGDLLAEYCSIEEAAKKTGICRTNIGNCCNYRQHTAGGFRWEFVKKTESSYKSAS